MKIELDTNEIIPLEKFELNWRWDEIHNPDISAEDKGQIKPLSIKESKRINKVIDYLYPFGQRHPSGIFFSVFQQTAAVHEACWRGNRTVW